MNLVQESGQSKTGVGSTLLRKDVQFEGSRGNIRRHAGQKH